MSEKNKMKGKKQRLFYRHVKGSVTIETAYLLPVLLSAFFLTLYTVFYYHDKVIINAAAGEIAAAGAAYERQHMGSEEELTKFYRDRVQGKLILLRLDQVDVEIGKDEVKVSAKASFQKMTVSAQRRARIIRPEKKIRAKRLLTLKKGE